MKLRHFNAHVGNAGTVLHSSEEEGSMEVRDELPALLAICWEGALLRGKEQRSHITIAD